MASSSQFTIYRIISFKDIYPTENVLEPQVYLRGISKEFILKIASAFATSKFSDFEKVRNPSEIIDNFFSHQNQTRQAPESILLTLNRERRKPRIINTYSSLQLFKLAFQYCDENETQTENESELSVFKAYLAINEKLIANESNVMNSTKGEDFLIRFPIAYFIQAFMYSDVYNFNPREQMKIQLLKGVAFFKYLETTTSLSALLPKFLEYYELENWMEYYIKVVPIANLFTPHDYEGFVEIEVPRDENFDNNSNFLNKLSISDSATFSDFDFNSLRSAPIYKSNNGTYFCCFGLFVIDKLFDGLYFQLKDICERFNLGISNARLKSVISNDFSEKVLLYETLKNIYNDRNYVQLTGEEMSTQLPGSTDFYLRIHEKIFLFESKDFLIPSVVKESRDFNLIIDELEKRLYFENLPGGREKAGAIMQLIFNIKKILNKELPYDSNYRLRDVKIYPIIVIHNHRYNTVGLNRWMDYWFQAEIERLTEEGYRVRNVQPLVIMDIASLIMYQDYLKSGEIQLNDIIDRYNNETRISENDLEEIRREETKYFERKSLPFNYFLDNFAKRRGFVRAPQAFMELGSIIFPQPSNSE